MTSSFSPEGSTVAIRARSLAGLETLGISIEADRNAAAHGTEEDISASGSAARVFVIPTNEELLIARDTVRCVRNAPRRW